MMTPCRCFLSNWKSFTRLGAREGRLTHRGYDTVGDVSAAVANAAETILEETSYAGLPPDDLACVIFA